MQQIMIIFFNLSPFNQRLHENEVKLAEIKRNILIKTQVHSINLGYLSNRL